MQNVRHLLRARRFAPLFATQFLGAFNDSLFKQGVVLFVTYQLYSDAAREAQFNAIAQALFILPFFLFSALASNRACASWMDSTLSIAQVASPQIGFCSDLPSSVSS